MFCVKQQLVLKRVRERTMSDIVKQYGKHRCIVLRFGNFDTLLSQLIEHAYRKVHCPDRMLKTCMKGAGVNKIGKSKLLDEPEPLKKGVINNVINQLVLNPHKTVQGIIDYLHAMVE